jgi:hypothetical protein
MVDGDATSESHEYTTFVPNEDADNVGPRGGRVGGGGWTGCVEDERDELQPAGRPAFYLNERWRWGFLNLHRARSHTYVYVL